MSAKVFLTGRIANELKIKKIKENKVMEFNLACRDGKNTEFIPCTVWNSQAEMELLNEKEGEVSYEQDFR